MKEQIISIVQLFASRIISNAKCTEDFLRLECEADFTLLEVPSVEELLSRFPKLAARDSWQLRLLSETGDDLFDIRTGSNINTDYDVSQLEPYKNDNVRIIYSINKNKKEDTLTIYEYGAFLDYVQGLCVPDFISVYRSNLSDRLILEIWDSDAECFCTSGMAVIKQGETMPQLLRDEKKIQRIDESKAYCQWNNKLSYILPEDVRIISRGEAGKLAELFDQMCLLLSALYLADFSSVDKSKIKLRMAGLKMMETEIAFSEMRDLSFDLKSVDQWYRIYDWCYTGGYISERLSITRNIITLNCTNTKELALNPSTFDAIKSNFKIFEKDNVRQYIKVRNEVSKTLLDLQDKVNSTVETFTGDFRKNVVGLGTFFLTLVVVRVVSRGDWIGGFTTQIVSLSFVFIILSFVILSYSRRVVEKKEALYAKHYNLLRQRYSALLSNEELDELFKDGDPNKYGSHANYIQWQKKVYTWIWAGALLLFSVFLTLAWCYNLFESTNVFKIIKSIIICCTKNI